MADEIPPYRQTFTITIDRDDAVPEDTLKQAVILGLDALGIWGVYDEDVTVTKVPR